MSLETSMHVGLCSSIDTETSKDLRGVPQMQMSTQHGYNTSRRVSAQGLHARGARRDPGLQRARD